MAGLESRTAVPFEPALDAPVEECAFVSFAEHLAQSCLDVTPGNAPAAQFVQDPPVALLAAGGPLEGKLAGKTSVIEEPFTQQPSHHLPGQFGRRASLPQILLELKGGVGASRQRPQRQLVGFVFCLGRLPGPAHCLFSILAAGGSDNRPLAAETLDLQPRPLHLLPRQIRRRANALGPQPKFFRVGGVLEGVLIADQPLLI